MISANEERALKFLTVFIKQNKDFKTIPVNKAERNVIADLIDEGISTLFKGSYKEKDIALGLAITPDDVNGDEPDVSMIYLVPCEAEFSFLITPETTADRVTKQIGLKIEMEVGHKDIDFSYLINSNDPGLLTELSKEDPLKDFLMDNTARLEEFGIRENLMHYRKRLDMKTDTFENIEKDLETLLEMVVQVENGVKN